MTNPQGDAARRVLSKFRTFGIRFEVATDADGSDVLTPLRASDGVRGEAVTISKNTSAAEVTRMLTQASQSLV